MYHLVAALVILDVAVYSLCRQIGVVGVVSDTKDLQMMAVQASVTQGRAQMLLFLSSIVE